MPKGYLLLILHAHLPYVRHPEFDRFLEERWFFEAVTETYIPLIKFFDQLRDEQIPFKLTLSVSPPLTNMMEDEMLRDRCRNHLDMLVTLAERECERTKDWTDVNFLAQMYRRLFEEARDIFVNRCGTRLLKAFKDLADTGQLELITCAGTHGYLPLLRTEPSAVRAQILTAVAEYERLFGKAPVGMWLPECAYYPGLDELLREVGVRYFVLDAQGIEHADPKPLFGVHAPLYCPSGVAAFGRNPSTSRLVWSSMIGYPADTNYREYYRDIGFDLDQKYMEPFQYAPGVRTQTGIKYHRITGPTTNKQLYNPDWARAAVERHARDFVNRCKDQAARFSYRMPVPPVIVSPYDAELFGHWWFEGPQWIYHVVREIGRQDDLALTTPAEYLHHHPIQQRAVPSPSSWGRNGYHEHWANPKTDWMWRPLHEAAERMSRAVGSTADLPRGGLADRTLRQAGRELLLAQSSDWPFIISNGTTEEYAKRRFHDHLNRFHELLGSLDSQQFDAGKLEALETMDAVFPELDYHAFGPA